MSVVVGWALINYLVADMKLLILPLIFFSLTASAVDDIYLKVGAGYKLSEPRTVELQGLPYNANFGHPLTARVELGVEVSPKLTIGVAHHSHWLSGKPVNDEYEYFKTEFFVDYKFSLLGD